jgi:hypothetical protein
MANKKTIIAPVGDKIPLSQQIPGSYQIQKINFMSGLINQGISTGGQATALNNTLTAYTCPIGKNFFCIGFSLSSWNTAAGSGQGAIYFKDFVILDLLTPGAGSFDNTVMSPSIPLKLNPGETIKITSSNETTIVVGRVFGYEIDAVLVPTFI